MNIQAEKLSSAELIQEIYWRINRKEIVLKVRKWRSKMGGLGKIKVIFLAERGETKNFLTYHPTEGTTLYLEGRQII